MTLKKDNAFIMVVMPKTLQQKIKIKADEEGRSMSNYCLRMIQKSMRESKAE